jgi:hypothetical protein
MIRWIYYPLSDGPTPLAKAIADVFQKHAAAIDSSTHAKQDSDEVLGKVAASLNAIGFQVEQGKKRADRIRVPVLFGEMGRAQKSFDADAIHAGEGFVVEVEAGRGVTNHQFLKDIFEASMMHGVQYLAIAVRNDYRGGNDYDKVVRFVDTLYASSRMRLPLKGLLIIGY